MQALNIFSIISRIAVFSPVENKGFLLFLGNYSYIVFIKPTVLSLLAAMFPTIHLVAHR